MLYFLFFEQFVIYICSTKSERFFTYLFLFSNAIKNRCLYTRVSRTGDDEGNFRNNLCFLLVREEVWKPLISFPDFSWSFLNFEKIITLQSYWTCKYGYDTPLQDIWSSYTIATYLTYQQKINKQWKCLENLKVRQIFCVTILINGLFIFKIDLLRLRWLGRASETVCWQVSGNAVFKTTFQAFFNKSSISILSSGPNVWNEKGAVKLSVEYTWYGQLFSEAENHTTPTSHCAVWFMMLQAVVW